MPDEGREPFIQMAREDKIRFDEEIGVWKANGGMQKAKAAKRAAKDVNARGLKNPSENKSIC